MSVDEIKAMVRRFAEEPWSKGDLSVFDAVCAPEYRIHHMDGKIESLAGIKKAVMEARSVVHDLRSTVNDIIVDGDRVAYGWTMEGTDNGKPRKILGMTFLRLKNGKIIDDRYVNNEVELEHPAQKDDIGAGLG